ncbi:MAG TPA: hypothetical protein DDZ80_02830 [Cyanobacteria bacterium UBA8803]|nr:hypothetical protein [Cyanobacteria bacterium UBA9273]HBL57513.1 hypothetical protein [Cyanobacteria bacterium UBA8803]
MKNFPFQIGAALATLMASGIASVNAQTLSIQAYRINREALHSSSHPGESRWRVDIPHWQNFTAQGSNLDQLWQQATELLGLGQYNEAIALFDQILKLQPNSFLAWYWRGNSFKNLGQYETAIASYQAALQIEPDYLLAWFEQGNTLYQLQQYEASIRSWRQALSVQTQSDYEQQLVRVIIPKRIADVLLYDLQQYEEAIASYDQLLSVQPNTATLWIDRGTALYQLSRYEEAIANYDRAIQLDANNALAWKRRGFALYRLNRDQQAIASFERAASLEPNDVDITGLLALLKTGEDSQTEVRLSAQRLATLRREISAAEERLVNLRQQSQIETEQIAALQAERQRLERELAARKPPSFEPGLGAFNAEMQIFQQIAQQESRLTRAFEKYLGISGTRIKTLSDTLSALHEIERTTRAKPALVYSYFMPTTPAEKSVPAGVKSLKAEISQRSPSRNQTETDEDPVELVLVTADGRTIRRRIETATRSQIREMADQFFSNVTNVRNPNGYLEPAQKLYQWLIAPLEDVVQLQQIDNLTFLMDKSLRSLPLAALHDGKGFLAERYSLGIMPSLALTDTRYGNLRNAQVLAMGAQEFPDKKPLPAVPVELDAIANRIWQGESYLNEEFTVETLKRARQREPFGLVHFATHAEFRPGQPNNSYIELWGGTKLGLDQIRQLQLDSPPVDLLVLSACRTALGNEEAELGFAGLAVKAGVKSAMGSLWYVSDEGTLALMTTFYKKLKEVPVKAEALRQAQVAMIRGDVRIEGGQLVVENERFPLPPELAKLGDKKFSHPYYWSAFMMIGNPW